MYTMKILQLRRNEGRVEAQKRFAIVNLSLGSEMMQEIESTMYSLNVGRYVRCSSNMRPRNQTCESTGMGEPHNTKLGRVS